MLSLWSESPTHLAVIAAAIKGTIYWRPPVNSNMITTRETARITELVQTWSTPVTLRAQESRFKHDHNTASRGQFKHNYNTARTRESQQTWLQHCAHKRVSSNMITTVRAEQRQFKHDHNAARRTESVQLDHNTACRAQSVQQDYRQRNCIQNSVSSKRHHNTECRTESVQIESRPTTLSTI